MTSLQDPAAITRRCAMCDAEVRLDSKFCRDCGAPQAVRPMPPAPAAVPAGRSRSAWPVAAAAVALLAVGGALVAILLLGGDGGNTDRDAQRIVAAANVTLDRLQDAVLAAAPADAGSMAALRATAARAAAELGDTRIDARALAIDRGDAATRLQALQRALEADEALARALAGAPPLADTIERLAASGSRAAPGLTEVDTAPLVAGLRERSRARAAAARKRKARKHAAAAERASRASAAVSFTLHEGLGYQAQVPTGDGWSRPSDSQPTAGALFRTSVRGPNGMFVIIDYTPDEPAVFGGSFQSRRSVSQTAFGSATEYVFQGGRLSECQRSRCVDYILNDDVTGAGFGVLAGGPDFDLARQIARTVMESLTS